MGGLHSGRKAKYPAESDCLKIDLADLAKQKLFERSGRAIQIMWPRWRETNFHERKDASCYASFVFDGSQVLLSYQSVATSSASSKETKNHLEVIGLNYTPCHYGGQRRWFVCPGCYQRARVLYLSLTTRPGQEVKPLCQKCLDMHYTSQLASYIDRHKTYERHLLANYGLWWAANRYDWELKEHYLKMTPDLRELKDRSQEAWQLQMIKEIIKFDLFILKMDLHKFKSLRSEGDRKMYLEMILERPASNEAWDAVRLLKQSTKVERLVMDINAENMPDDLYALYERFSEHPALSSSEIGKEVLSEQDIKQKIVDLRSTLKQLNKESQEKAA